MNMTHIASVNYNYFHKPINEMEASKMDITFPRFPFHKFKFPQNESWPYVHYIYSCPQ